ncbi:MAG: ligase-associated DNA damage response endonuclease PdeM [Haloferula sp.]
MLIHHQGIPIELLADHAAFLPGEHCLVVSDLHLGKAGVFRAHGLAVPDGDDSRDLDRLLDLVDSSKAAQLVIAGDLFHAPSDAMGDVLELLHEWAKRCPAEVTLVTGNHDQRALRGAKLPFARVDALKLNSVSIVHDPSTASTDAPLTLCGHLHPVIRIRDGRRTSIRSACFWLGDQLLTLPSFGSFTGGQIIHPKSTDRIFIPLRDRITEVPSSCWK